MSDYKTEITDLCGHLVNNSLKLKLFDVGMRADRMEKKLNSLIDQLNAALLEPEYNQKTFQQQLVHYSKIAYDNPEEFTKRFKAMPQDAVFLDVYFDASQMVVRWLDDRCHTVFINTCLDKFVRWAKSLGDKT